MDQKTNITGSTPPEIIEQDIARTREEMSGTVEEIQERLSAGHFKATMKEKIRDRFRGAAGRVKTTASKFGQTAKERGSTVMDTSRDAIVSNPVPIAMMAIGLGWLLYNRRSSYSRTTAVRQKTGEIAAKAQEAAGELRSELRERGSRFAGTAKQAAEQFSISAREQANVAKSKLQQLTHDNPVGILMGAFAIGSLIGFSIPASRREQDVMGPASESLVGKAKETAQRTMQKAQHAAESAAEAAKKEFKKEAA